MAAPTPRDAVRTAHRVVVKVGSSSLTAPGGGLAPERIRPLVDALADHGRSLMLAAQENGEPVRRPSEKKTTARRKAKA